MPIKKRENGSVEQLNEMQRYLGLETIEGYQAGQMSRRRMLSRLILICGGVPTAAALLVACGDASPTTGNVAPPAGSTSQTSTSAAINSPALSTTVAMTSAGATTNNTTTAPTNSTTAVSSTSDAGRTTVASQEAKSPLSVAENDPLITTNTITTLVDPSPNQPYTTYIAQPKGDGPFPGLVVIHENTGLTDHIKDVARRLAKAGYLAAAPDLASQGGGTAALGTDKVAAFLGAAKPEDLVSILKTTLGVLDSTKAVKKGKYGVVGFCFGGGYTLRFAAANPKIVAAVSYYGPVPTPVTQMSNTQAAILGQYGGLDSRVNAGIPDLEKTLKEAGKTYEKRIYAGANHAFNNDTGANYNEIAALAAWKETLSWFDRYLKA